MKLFYQFSAMCFLTFLVTSCSGPYEYWDVSQFNINESILDDQEDVTLIYSSGSPDKSEVDFYVHLVVVSDASGDTVNILSPVSNRFTQNDLNTTFTFSDQHSAAVKAIQNLDNLKEENLNKVNFKEYSKVARDPKFDFIADNKFPTTIGMIGDMFYK